MYIIGIDGGGTKTSFGLFKDDQLIDTIEKGTCHFLQVGYEGCALILKQGIEELIQKHHISNVKIGIGMAGYGSDEKVRHHIEEALHKHLQSYEYYLTNDIHIALLGALNGEDGICVIAGTGSIAMALVDNVLYRSGGWGYQLADEGSAYWIGKELIREFTWQADGRKEKDEIYNVIMDYFNLDNPYQLISKVSLMNNQRGEIALLASFCDQLSEHNQTCQIIIKNAAYYASMLAKALIHYYKQPLITYYGGVFKSQLFEKTFKELLKDYQVVKPMHSPMHGAYYFVNKSIYM